MNNITAQRNEKYSILNYFFIAMVILRSPLQSTILSIDGKGRIYFLLTIVVFIINYRKRLFKKLFFSTPILFWLLWCIYSAINTYFKGVYNTSTSISFFIILQIFCPLVTMGVTAYEYTKNANKLLKFSLWTFLLYAFIGAVVMDIGYIAAANNIENANTLGNALGLNVSFIIFYTSIIYCKREISLKKAIMYISIAFLIIILSATRKALGGCVIMIIGLIFSNIKLTFSNFIKLLFPLSILYIGMNYILGNTQMGERFNEIDEVNERLSQKYDIEGNIFLEAMGDRAPQYIVGTEVFLENPITGIGLRNYPIATNTPYQLHTEYMVQLSECGIIGTTLFILFYLTIIKGLLNTYRNRKDERAITIAMMSTLLAILFINLTTWSYAFPFYFAVLGCIIAHIKKNKII